MKHLLPACLTSLALCLAACDSSAPPPATQDKAAPQANVAASAPAELDAAAPPSQCYAQRQGDGITVIQLQQEGNSIFGYYAWEPQDRDGSHGILNGEIADGLIKASHTYMIEGNVQTAETYFRQEGGKLLQGEGELQEENGMLVFKDPASIRYTKALEKVDCASVQAVLERNEEIAAAITEQQAEGDGLDLTMLEENLVGTWQSIQDPKSQLAITADQYTETYDGKAVSANPYQLLESCPESCGASPSDTPCLRITGQDEMCYAVILADGEKLELSLVNGKGNTNQYQRIDNPSGQ